MEIKCKWCTRKARVSKKGLLLDHTDAGGKKCVAVGILVAKPTLTPPKDIKGTVQRNLKRRT